MAGRQARGVATQEAIVEAALTLFSEAGFGGTSVAAVAKKVGMTDAGVLYHFPTKDDLLLAVLAHADRRYQRGLDEVAGDGRSALEQLRTWGAGMEADIEICALHVRLSAEHLRDDSPAHQWFARRYRALHATITELLRGVVDDPEAEASAFVAHLDGLRLQWFFAPEQVSIAGSVRRYVDRLLDAA